MLNFLNTFFLPFLAGALLPIIIHLFARHKRKIIRFPSLMFLKKIQEQRMRRMKLRQLILLILRTLIVLLVVAAFARLTVRGLMTAPVGSHERTAVAILIDRSYSTSRDADGVSVFSREKALADKVLSLLKPGDECALIPFDSAPRPSTEKATHLFGELSATVETLSVSYNTTDVVAALQKGLEMLKETKTAHKEIYLISDNAENGWQTPGKLSIPDDTYLFIMPVEGSYTIDWGITDIVSPQHLLEIGVPADIVGTVRNSGDAPAAHLLVGLSLDGKRVAQSEIQLSPGETKQIALSANIDKGGIHSGFLGLPGDELTPDNKRYFSFTIPKRVRVLVAGDGDLVNIFTAALTAGKGDFFAVRTARMGNLNNELLRNTDAVVLLDTGKLPQSFESRLTQFVRSGGGALLIGTDFDGELLSSLGGVDMKGSIGTEMGNSFLSLGETDFTHPIMEVFADNKLPQIKCYTALELGENSAKTIVHFDNGYPAVLEDNISDGKVVTCAFSLHWTRSDLMKSGLFVPFAQRSVQYLSGEKTVFERGYIVGDDVSRTIEQAPASAQLIVISPNGTKEYPQPRFVSGHTVLPVKNTDVPGIYRILADSTIVDAFPVNVAPEEAVSRRLADPALTKRIEGHEPIFIENEDKQLEAQILNVRYGKELWRMLIWLAALLMAIELVLGSEWRKEKKENEI